MTNIKLCSVLFALQIKSAIAYFYINFKKLTRLKQRPEAYRERIAAG
jgi:hypothetical protein